MIDLRLGTPGEVGGLGPAQDEPRDPAELRESAGRLARDLEPGETVLARPRLAGARLTAFVEGLLLGGYRFTYASTPTEPTTVVLTGTTDVEAYERGVQTAAATVWARDLANTPANIKTPNWLGQRAREELEPLKVRVAVRDEEWLATRGFGGVLAVGHGSVSPPCLIEATWRPRNPADGVHVVLVGKGITFDSGGLNIKPGDNMRAMKTDMAGGAAVLAALKLVAQRRLGVSVTALVPAAENAFGAASFRPGDVVRHFGGRTSEINNTDAEGRLVLADALAYAVSELSPTVIVDIATLTGAMKVALGLRTAGFFATDERLAGQLSAAGGRAGEPLWRMPLLADYESTLASSIADADNAPGSPGAITAALFLKHFVGSLPWAHLDIAGPGRSTKDDGIRAQGATGFGAALLADWIESLA